MPQAGEGVARLVPLDKLHTDRVRRLSAAETIGIIFRIVVSREDAAELESLRTFTRELMADAEQGLHTKLDWVAGDHWNTDHPHVRVVIRARVMMVRTW